MATLNPIDNVTGAMEMLSKCLFTNPNGMPPNYDLLITFSWYDSKVDGLFLSSTGDFGKIIDADLGVMVMSSYFKWVIGLSVKNTQSKVVISSFADIYLPGVRKNWVAWSNVGSLLFTIDRANVAGEMPLDWDGYVQNIHKLVNKVIAYGENGVSILTPAGNSYGLNTIHRIGLKGRDSFAGNDFVHYFIDNLGCLYSLSDGLKMLDYREYLSLMTDPVLTLDETNNLLYICDGTLGYIYSPDTKSFGAGPVNVTGIGSRGGLFYVAAPAIITTPAASLVTDIYDFGSRKQKTIYGLEFGTDLTEPLQVAVDSRTDKAAAFVSTAFVPVTANGKARIIKKGVEFRFKLKGLTYEDFDLDSFTINGKVHAH